MAACDLATYDLCISEGTDYSLALTLLDDNGDPEDLTGAVADLTISLPTETLAYSGVINGNTITFSIPETVVFTAYRGRYQADYTVGTITKRALRGNVDIEKAL